MKARHRKRVLCARYLTDPFFITKMADGSTIMRSRRATADNCVFLHLNSKADFGPISVPFSQLFVDEVDRSSP